MLKTSGALLHKYLPCIGKFSFRTISQSPRSRINLKSMENTTDQSGILAKCRLLPPPLSEGKHKGQAGRVGVFGGSLDYTGAPYFASISSLKVGADLVYVFTTKNAAPVIKSYSPELIVHPYLDLEDADRQIEPWLDRLHVAVIGPGLGRDSSIFEVIKKVIAMCKTKNIPLVIDADGLFLVSENPEILRDYPNKVILTPNKMEFARLVGNKGEGSKIDQAKQFFEICSNLTFVCKDKEDQIFNSSKSAVVSGGGSGRRCGGQGDLLSGSLGTCIVWALQCNEISDEEKAIVAGYASCLLTRGCNAEAFKTKGRSMVCTDMIGEIHKVFEKYFES